MYSKKVVASTVGRVLGRPFLASSKRGLSTATEGTISNSTTGSANPSVGGQISVRCYSMSGKRTPVTPAEKEQQEQGQGSKTVNVARGKVPKFTMARTEFMVADFFAQNRQVVGISSEKIDEQMRPSFKTLSELALYQGHLMDEDVPRAKLQQVYAAPASVYMRVTPDAFIPEAMRLGPLAEPLLGRDSFGEGIGSLQMFGSDVEMREFVEEFFDAVLDNAKQAPVSGMWSIRRDRRARGERWMTHEMVDPFDEISGQPVGYQMTSVRRKRKTKMNKHKHRKLRRSTRALRKRLGK
ncbi:hypothetical protein J3B02_000368 [Coemansia erecta]|uniref:Ribosomal protein mS38 C-terminal domain-containing protein n=1 Tax=Coemansia asiatica TaxID=1052880 RepID=A0A9W7XFC0_9FUNG|nr:hypothetical protein LPJ64_004925 [Coemansia asiatica]KAJ2858298.1 hypothetical protein J3B02_000368 [Coemansia erecta]